MQRVGNSDTGKESTTDHGSRRRAYAAVRLIALVPMLIFAPAAMAQGDAQAPALSPLKIINPRSFYPEGAFWADGKLFYAEMSRDRVMTYDGQSHTPFWSRQGCGPTSIATLGDAAAEDDERFLVLCHLADALAVVSKTGETLAMIETDSQGQPIRWPNDSIADGRGGVYVSSSGRFNAAAAATGAVLHVAPTGAVRQVAGGIRYANGLALSADGRRLLVSEHLGRRVLSYGIGTDGALSDKRVFVDFATNAPPPPHADDLAGPDGLTVDRSGRVWVCEYGAGRILVFSPAAQMIALFIVPDRFVTNISFGASENDIYVTAPATNQVRPYVGRVYKLDNPFN